MPDFDLSITICSWNTREFLRACLESISALREETNLEVIVVDNASEDGSVQMVQADFQWVRLEAMKENLGFGRGHNHAFATAHGRYLMPLNSDTEVHPGALRAIVEFMDKNSDVGVLGPKLLNPDGSLQFSCRRFPNPVAALFRNTFLGRLFPKNKFTRDYLMQDWQHNEQRDVDWVSGAGFCMRRELYERIGGFDEQFFMYLEDVDLCYRTHEAGFRVVYFPEAVITHAIGKSTDIVANKMIRQFHHSMWLFYRKSYLPKMSLLIRPFAAIAARTTLYLRQSTFILKNKLDDWKRRRGKL